MKLFIYLLVALVIIVSCKQKKENPAIKEKAVEIIQENSTKEWVTLFDGSSFDNWRGYLAQDMYPEWSIEDGTMLFTPSEKGDKNIITKQKYTNFVLSLEWKISQGGNSGIFWGIYEDEKFKKPYNTGPEIQILDNQRHPDAKANPKYHQAGALYDMVQPKYDVCKPVGEWNKCVIKINHKSNLGSVTLNGTVIVEFNVHGAKWDAMVADSKFKDWEDFGKHQTGHIGLQDHGDKVWYRNIKIKEL